MGRMKDLAIEAEGEWADVTEWQRDQMLSEVTDANATMPRLGERTLRGVNAGEPLLAARCDEASGQQCQGQATPRPSP